MTPDKVNQADRALAAFIAGENGFAWTGQMYLGGQLDDDKIIEAIRHHRLSHSPADEGLREAASSAEFQQQRGRALDLIDWAINEYREFMLDDDYNAQGTLDRIISRLRDARPDLHDPRAALSRDGAS